MKLRLTVLWSGWLLSLAVSAQAPAPTARVEPLGEGAPSAAWPQRPQARSNRHALIISISRYANAAVAPLPGARIDRQSATQMAQAMQVPVENTHYLQDEQASGDGIRQALQQLTDRVQPGDRVYIHYSGHGTRNPDPASGGCVEALLAHDAGQAGVITNQELAERLKAITQKTDKLLVMIDACHSGGVVQAATAGRTRALGVDEGVLRPRSAVISEECARPVNIRTRSLLNEASTAGVLPQDIIHVSASRHNEISFDDENRGGLATQFVRDCMLRDASDLDNSGAVSMEEIRQCAQEKINRRLARDPNFTAHNLVLNGNAGFVPAWFARDSASASVAEPASLTGEQALRQLYDQRDAKRRVQISAAKDRLKIGQDELALVLQSDRPGYVYLVLAGSDQKSLYLLFPNDLDKNNQIEAGKPLVLPRANWRVKASGPPGKDTLLAMVSDAPRDLKRLANHKAGPFMSSVNDAQGRAQLGLLLTASEFGASPICAQAGKARPAALCSDAYGASMLSIEELP